MAERFVIPTGSSETFKNNIMLAADEQSASRQQAIILMEIARLLDMIAQAKTPTVHHVGHASAD